MLWIKSFHIIFMVTWFSGLFYLPRLFVYHAMATDETSLARFKIMERKLYYGITTPGAIFTLFFGIWMLYAEPAYMHMQWLHIKLSLVLLLILYYVYLGYLLNKFKHNNNTHSHVFYRIINEIPVIFLVAIVILAIVKPWGMV
ncbi:MAG: TIGR00701 family protein [Gammaproteobacteria bacterium RIFCSPHIGHO2_12_FULL_41_20]|nr:MAG: TIGR00701 family protein [Gammaproteobacteria bacterium RIFCSPHIGHO2_12_FULL_41_20]